MIEVMRGLSPSFSEEKEAKRLLPFGIVRRMVGCVAPEGAKVFWFFFSKKNRFLSSSGTPQ